MNVWALHHELMSVISWTYERYIMNVWALYHERMSVTSWTYERYIMNVWALHHERMSVTSWTYERYIMNVWALYHERMSVVSWTYERYIMNVWALYHERMSVISWTCAKNFIIRSDIFSPCVSTSTISGHRVRAYHLHEEGECGWGGYRHSLHYFQYHWRFVKHKEIFFHSGLICRSFQ